MLLLVFGDSVTDLGVGVRSAAAASLCFFCRFLRWILTKDGGKRGAHIDPSLTRHSSSVLVNRQDQAPYLELDHCSNSRTHQDFAPTEAHMEVHILSNGIKQQGMKNKN